MVLAATGAAPANAKVFVVTYGGTVSLGYDTTGVFGTANADLGGKTFVARYTFDDANGYVYTSPMQNYAYGGTAYGNTSPSLGATVTIGGKSVSLAGTYFGYAYGVNYPYVAQQYHAVQDYSNDGVNYNSNYVYGSTYTYGSSTLPATLSTPYNGPLGQYNYGYFGSYGYNYITNQTTANTYAYLNAERFSIAGAVPEPATWLMMILGFGTVGGTMRAARRHVSAALAHA